MCGVQTAARLAGALCVSAGLLAAWASGLHAEQRNGPSSNPSSFPSVTRGAAAERGGPSARVTEPQASSRNLRGRLVRADVIVRHQLFEANGRSLGPLPDVRYRLSRELRNGRWVDRLDIVQPPAVLVTYPDGVRAVPNPFAGRGVERVDGEDEVMVIGADGKPRPVVDDEVKRFFGWSDEKPRSSIGSFRGPGGSWLAEAGREQERRVELERQFGRARDRVRGLDRYVQQDPHGRLEVFVAPETVLPVEIRGEAADGGRIQTSLEYDFHPGLGHVRRRLRAEHRFAGAGGGVTEVEIINVETTGEVGP